MTDIYSRANLEQLCSFLLDGCEGSCFFDTQKRAETGKNEVLGMLETVFKDLELEDAAHLFYTALNTREEAAFMKGVKADSQITAQLLK